MNYWNAPLYAPFHRIEKGYDVFEFHSLADAFRLMRDARANDADAKLDSLRWCGILESAQDFDAHEGAQKAIDDFRAASAALPLHANPGAMSARPYGGAWVIPEVLNGSPLPARVRPRTKLPPREIKLHLSFAAFVDFNEIARCSAKVARAAWDYILRGGVIDCVAQYEAGYSKRSNRNTRGCVIRVHSEVSSEWNLAQSVSVQFARGVAWDFIQALSGLGGGDPLRQSREFKLDAMADIRGESREADDAELAKLGIE